MRWLFAFSGTLGFAIGFALAVGLGISETYNIAAVLSGFWAFAMSAALMPDRAQ